MYNDKIGMANWVVKMNILEVKNLSFQYSQKLQALNNVSLSVSKGEFLCLFYIFHFF